MKILISLCATLALVTACSSAPPHTAAVNLIKQDADIKDIARCGGLGIDDRVGLTIAREKDKFGGELSAERVSEIRIDAMRNGMMTGDEKKYQAYVQCIIELDKRRSVSTSSTERLGQPFIKVHMEPVRKEAGRMEFLVENNGDELTELSVTPMVFLYIGELHIAGTPEPADGKPLRCVYAPVVDAFEAAEEFPNEYKGVLYRRISTDENAFRRQLDSFADSDGRHLNTYQLFYAAVDYRDKFGTQHHRVFSINPFQHELDADVGDRLVATYQQGITSGNSVKVGRTSAANLERLWLDASRPLSDKRPWGNAA